MSLESKEVKGNSHLKSHLALDKMSSSVKETQAKKVLIVEDNLITQASLQEMLKQLNVTADFADNGKDALMLYHCGYQLVLMDIELPYLNGMEVTQIIRAFEKNHCLPNVPIIAITSHSHESEYQKQCLAAGISKVFGKPTFSQLEALVEAYITHDPV